MRGAQAIALVTAHRSLSSSVVSFTFSILATLHRVISVQCSHQFASGLSLPSESNVSCYTAGTSMVPLVNGMNPSYRGGKRHATGISGSLDNGMNPRTEVRRETSYPQGKQMQILSYNHQFPFMLVRSRFPHAVSYTTIIRC